jgi:hypothetical protein
MFAVINSTGPVYTVIPQLEFGCVVKIDMLALTVVAFTHARGGYITTRQTIEAGCGARLDHAIAIGYTSDVSNPTLC